MRRGWLTVMVVGTSMAVVPARAQYRNTGIVFEAGPQVMEMAPYTVATVVSTEVMERLWGRYVGDVRVPKRPRGHRTCWERVHDEQALPCRYDWYGAGDGPYVGIGFQRVTGGFPVDMLDRPFLENLVVTGRFGVTLAPHPWPRGFPTPVFVLQEELAVRWNFFDEKFRPFVALGAGLATIFDPQAVYGSVRSNDQVCQQAGGTTGVTTARDATCVDQRNWVPQSPVTLNPSVGMFVMENFPTMITLRPEVGVERFVAEDISVQVAGSVAVQWTPLPRMALHAPFAGVSPRAHAAVVFYF